MEYIYRVLRAQHDHTYSMYISIDIHDHREQSYASNVEIIIEFVAKGKIFYQYIHKHTPKPRYVASVCGGFTIQYCIVQVSVCTMTSDVLYSNTLSWAISANSPKPYVRHVQLTTIFQVSTGRKQAQEGAVSVEKRRVVKHILNR